MTWENRSGECEEWRLQLPNRLGYITVHRHRCAGAPRGWRLSGNPLFYSWGHGEPLESKTLEDAQREAVERTRTLLHGAIQTLTRTT